MAEDGVGEKREYHRKAMEWNLKQLLVFSYFHLFHQLTSSSVEAQSIVLSSILSPQQHYDSGSRSPENFHGIVEKP